LADWNGSKHLVHLFHLDNQNPADPSTLVHEAMVGARHALADRRAIVH
jgi:hypothetical protein